MKKATSGKPAVAFQFCHCFSVIANVVKQSFSLFVKTFPKDLSIQD